MQIKFNGHNDFLVDFKIIFQQRTDLRLREMMVVRFGVFLLFILNPILKILSDADVIKKIVMFHMLQRYLLIE